MSRHTTRALPDTPAEDLAFLSQLIAALDPPMTARMTIDDMRDRTPEVMADAATLNRFTRLFARYPEHRPQIIENVDPMDIANWSRLPDDVDAEGRPRGASALRDRCGMAVLRSIRQLHATLTKSLAQSAQSLTTGSEEWVPILEAAKREVANETLSIDKAHNIVRQMVRRKDSPIPVRNDRGRKCVNLADVRRELKLRESHGWRTHAKSAQERPSTRPPGDRG